MGSNSTDLSNPSQQAGVASGDPNYVDPTKSKIGTGLGALIAARKKKQDDAAKLAGQAAGLAAVTPKPSPSPGQ